MEHEKRVFLILKISTILIFTGRGVQELSGSTIPFIGIILLASAFLLIFNWRNKVSIYFSSISSILLIFLSVVNFINHQWIAEQFIEHGIQLGVPILFTILHLYKIKLNKLKIVLKIFIALTFVGHGLFALGVHYVPSQFIEMTKLSLSFSSDQSITFLRVMGTMDIIVAFLIFFPGKINQYALIYAGIWGLLTAFARVYAYTDIYSFDAMILKGIPNFILRCPNGIIPFLVFFTEKNPELKKSFKLTV